MSKPAKPSGVPESTTKAWTWLDRDQERHERVAQMFWPDHASQDPLPVFAALGLGPRLPGIAGQLLDAVKADPDNLQAWNRLQNFIDQRRGNRQRGEIAGPLDYAALLAGAVQIRGSFEDGVALIARSYQLLVGPMRTAAVIASKIQDEETRRWLTAQWYAQDLVPFEMYKPRKAASASRKTPDGPSGSAPGTDTPSPA